LWEGRVGVRASNFILSEAMAAERHSDGYELCSLVELLAGFLRG
jgi:hypothetical protein